MTFREFVEADATWIDRLWCSLLGHKQWRPRREWHPHDEADDRREAERLAREPWCIRCGRRMEAQP